MAESGGIVFQEFAQKAQRPAGYQKNGTTNPMHLGGSTTEDGGKGKMLLEYWEGAKKNFRERKKRGDPEFPTGLSYIDNLTDGLHKGEVWTVAGRSGGGKTSLALQIARNIADNPANSVLFISLEMKGEELVSRMFCEMMRMTYDNIRIGEFPPEFQYKDKLFTDFLCGIDMEIVEYGYSFQEITKIITRYYPTKKPDVIIIDFAQLISWEKFSDQRVAMETYVRQLTELAKTHKFAVLLISQFRRPPTGADYNRPPDMMDMKGTGSLEQLSHVVLLVYKYIEGGVPRFKLKIAKNRNGETGEKEVRFIGEQFRFEEVG